MATMNTAAGDVAVGLRERVTEALGEGVVDLFEVVGAGDEVLLRLRSLSELDALPAVRDRLDMAGLDVANLGNGEISVREVA